MVLSAYVVSLRRIAKRTAEERRLRTREVLAQREAEHRAAYEARVAAATVHAMPERAERPLAVND